MNRNHFTILVVDDEALVRVALEALLKRNGYQVLQAGDGDEALALIESVHVDLLLTDLAMPGREGIETIIEVRQRFPHVTVVALSGVYGSFCLDMARQLGAAATLAKPVGGELLLRTIDTALDLRDPGGHISGVTPAA
jgi:CheY-like chemotaxis protein